MQWESVIGLEIHVQLQSKSKIFSGAPTTFGAKPNTQACAIDLGLPGVLPIVNSAVFRKAIQFGLSINAKINRHSAFDRKHYFYPDLPKGYQISQFYLPIIGRGQVEVVVDGKTVLVGITRAHLEEDAGKSLHEQRADCSAIDLNRAGIPLLEIVSEPDIRSAKEAVVYMKTIHHLVRYLGISDGNMQEGSFRCDANVSVRHQGASELGTRTEIKNLNSFRFLECAINCEIARQIAILQSGGQVVQQTCLYDSDRDETRPMRSKEAMNDYRYFPDPDLLPVVIEESYIESVRQTMPVLPQQKRQFFTQSLGLSQADAKALTSSKAMVDYFEHALAASGGATKLCANWIIVELSSVLNKAGLDIADSPVNAERLGGLVKRIADQTITGNLAKQVFHLMIASADDADQIIKAKGFKQVTDRDVIESLVGEVLAKHLEQIEDYRSGNKKIFGYLVGQVLKAAKGQANPQQVNEIIRARLDQMKD